ncbi:MAG: Glucosamine-6-phosphate deaminase, partial [Devosia sp.]|nr:Glucosamine-6-phosphate deaminase [Devosia sp.]
METSVLPSSQPDERRVDSLVVKSFVTRQQMGAVAAEEIAAELRQLLASQDQVRMVFAAAPSQSDVLASLVAAEGVDWGRVTAFHMDEYIGLAPDDPARFGNWLGRYIFDLVPFA